MEKLEQYLDQACRHIGGPKEMREHVRQELREHLLDAMAEHQTAGLTEAEALTKALEEFGNPEDVRSDLEAAHGQRRLLAVLIDKALDWKEKTMKAKWLWLTWAHLAVASVAALAIGWIAFASVFLVPKFQRLMMDGIIDSTVLNQQGVGWMSAFLELVQNVTRYPITLVLGALAAIGVFEWRVRSENKSLMRLSALGTIALAMLAVGVLMAAALVIPYLMTAPALFLMRPFALEQINAIDASVRGLDEALAGNNWEAMPEKAQRASLDLNRLLNTRRAIPSLTPNNPGVGWELQTKAMDGRVALQNIQQAIAQKDAKRMEFELTRFRKSFEPVKEAAKRVKQ